MRIDGHRSRSRPCFLWTGHDEKEEGCGERRQIRRCRSGDGRPLNLSVYVGKQERCIRQPDPAINRVLRSGWDPTGYSGLQRLVIWSLSMYLLLFFESKSCRYIPGFHGNRYGTNVSLTTGHLVTKYMYLLLFFKSKSCHYSP